MNAKKLKEIVSKIPDDAEVIFTYSMFEFENVGDVFKGKEITEYFESLDAEEDDFPHSEKTWMIEFNN